MLTEDEVKKMFGIKPQRTTKQNASLHVGCELLSRALNGAGFDVKKVIRVDIPWTMENVKEYLFKPFMSTMFPSYKSTTELDTRQVSEVWEKLLAYLSEKEYINENIPFPSEDELNFKKTPHEQM